MLLLRLTVVSRVCGCVLFDWLDDVATANWSVEQKKITTPAAILQIYYQLAKDIGGTNITRVRFDTNQQITTGYNQTSNTNDTNNITTTTNTATNNDVAASTSTTSNSNIPPSSSFISPPPPSTTSNNLMSHPLVSLPPSRSVNVPSSSSLLCELYCTDNDSIALSLQVAPQPLSLYSNNINNSSNVNHKQQDPQQLLTSLRDQFHKQYHQTLMKLHPLFIQQQQQQQQNGTSNEENDQSSQFLTHFASFKQTVEEMKQKFNQATTSSTTTTTTIAPSVNNNTTTTPAITTETQR